MNKKPRLSIRSAEALIRLAYELEEKATMFRHHGYEHDANSLKDMASQLGRMGRRICCELEER